MKKIAHFLAVLLLPLTWMTTGCTDFPDDYGLDASVEINNTVATATSAEKYDLSYKFKIIGEFNQVEEAYILLNDEKVAVLDLSKFDSNGCYTGTITDLSLNKQYSLRGGIKREACKVEEYSAHNIKYENWNFQPQLYSYNISMTAPNQITLVAQIKKQASFDLDGEFMWMKQQNKYTPSTAAQIETSITESGQYHVLKAIVDLDDAPTPGTSYTLYFGYSISNIFGTTSGYFSDPSIKYDNNGKTFDGDGIYNDYVQLCGVKWAKGNLQYDNGTWRIAPEQWSTFSYTDTPSSTQIEHFALGETDVVTVGAKRQNSSNPVYKTSKHVQGTSADVATVRLGSQWGIPNPSQFELLSSYASYAYNAKINGVKGYIYWPSSGRKYKINGLTISPSCVTDGTFLFLPERGYYYWSWVSSYSYKLNFQSGNTYYLTDYSIANSSYYHSVYYFNGNGTYTSKEYNMEYYPIRPVKLN